MKAITFLIRLIAEIFRRKSRAGLRSPEVNGPERKHPIIMIAPHVDDLTHTMSRWLAGVASRTVGASVLVGELASRANLMKFLSEHANEAVTIVFYGHGEEDRLLTHVDLGDGEVCRDGACRSLCTADDLTRSRGPHFVVAYCCSATRGMARTLNAHRPDSRFLGFRDEIDFVMGSPAREAAFSRPMEGAVVEACQTRTLDDLLFQTARDAYSRERERWLPRGEFGKDTRAPFMAMLLLQHRKTLDLIP